MNSIFILNVFTNWEYVLMVAMVVLFSVSLHEYFHAQTAFWLGDTTAADAGHLTLNPMKQMGWISLLMFALTSIAWGAVPVDSSRLKYKWGDLAVSFAGPFANLLLFLIAWVTAFALAALFPDLLQRPMLSRLHLFVYVFGIYNCALFLLNMFPGPGFDGWHILAYFAPKMRYPDSEAVRGFMLFALFAVLFCGTYLFAAGEYLMRLSLILGRSL